MKKESSTNLQKYSGIAEQMIKMLSDCPETTKNIIGTGQFQLASGKWVDAILYKYNGVYKMMEASEFIRLAEQDKSTTLDRIGDIIGTGYTPNIDPDKEEHNLPETEKYFYRLTKSNN